MNTTQQPISAYTLKALVQKLRPSRFPGMSGVTAAIVGLSSERDSAIAQIAVTSDDRVLARAEGNRA